jgi:hypothetical protein
MKALLIILLIAATTIFARPIAVKVCKEKNFDCQIIPLEDVKKIENIASGAILRITFFDGRMLDISVKDRYYEIKK